MAIKKPQRHSESFFEGQGVGKGCESLLINEILTAFNPLFSFKASERRFFFVELTFIKSSQLFQVISGMGA